MKKLLSLRFATNGVVIILTAIILFHLLVISRVVPSEIVWGGNISDKDQLWIMETVSIAINLFMLTLVCVYAGILKFRINTIILKVGFWIMFALFLLNTLGNLMAKNSLETYLFTPLTLLLAVFCFRIAAFGFKKTVD